MRKERKKEAGVGANRRPRAVKVSRPTVLVADSVSKLRADLQRVVDLLAFRTGYHVPQDNRMQRLRKESDAAIDKHAVATLVVERERFVVQALVITVQLWPVGPPTG